MEAWLDRHGSTLTESEWTDRLSRLETFREVVARRYSDWMLTALNVTNTYLRMKRHLDRERIERDYSLDFLTPGTNESSVRRQWRHFLKDDYEPPPF